MEVRKIEYPPFRNQVGFPPNIEESRMKEIQNCGFQVVKEGGTYLVNSEYYII